MANPLTKDDLENINAALVMNKELKEDLLRAEQAGINVDEQKKTMELQEQRLLQVKRTFFPTGRARGKPRES